MATQNRQAEQGEGLRAGTQKRRRSAIGQKGPKKQQKMIQTRLNRILKAKAEIRQLGGSVSSDDEAEDEAENAESGNEEAVSEAGSVTEQ